MRATIQSLLIWFVTGLAGMFLLDFLFDQSLLVSAVISFGISLIAVPGLVKKRQE